MPASPTTSARIYYNSPLTSEFYTTFWGGGTHISIGLYPTTPASLSPSAPPSDSSPHPHPPSSRPEPQSPIPPAVLRTTTHLASLIQPLNPQTRVLDLGSGFGGSARYLARTYGCQVTCLNLSEGQNERNRALCIEEGVERLIRVVEGSFEAVPDVVFEGVTKEAEGEEEGGKFDVIWAQDSFLHADDRAKLLSEVGRALVGKGKGGRVVVCDIMQTSTGTPASATASEMLAAYCRRLGIDQLATMDEYRRLAKAEGLEEMYFEDLSEHLVRHYGVVEGEMERRREEFLERVCSGEGGDGDGRREEAEKYLEMSRKGMRDGVQLIKDGCIVWGCFVLGR